MNINFEGKRILVTGAGSGIGRELSKIISTNGKADKIFALSKSQSKLDSLKKEVPEIEIICVDLGNWDETRRAVQAILPIHGLVNNAAIAQLAGFFEVSPEEFDESFNVNVKSVINVSQIVARDMKERGEGGTIVNISSQASLAALKDHLVYCSTKAALDSLTRVMALELGPYNIRVNSINPTVVLTEMGKIGWSDPIKAKTMLDKIPLGKFAEVDDVIHAILFLLSEKSGMISGIAFPIDGGFLST